MRILFISGHDYRTKRKANVHFIAKAATKRYDVTFYSTGYSWISDLIGRDPRCNSKITPNKEEMYQGVRCYLDRAQFHPGGAQGLLPEVATNLLFNLYIKRTPEILRKYIADSDIIIIESGIAAAFIRYVYDVKSSACVYYIASDDLATLNASPFLLSEIKKFDRRLAGIRIPSRMMKNLFSSGAKVYFVPHGIEVPAEADLSSPYQPDKVNAVSVGSMLFDPSFFEVAASAFPDVTFHVIGSGSKATFPQSNIIKYAEMPFLETLRYIKNASVGIAPYKMAKVPYYLADTSMKLMQYDYFGIPSVCPHFATTDAMPWRIGYSPADADSIVAAMKLALAYPRNSFNVHPIGWDDVLLRILNAENYAETFV